MSRCCQSRILPRHHPPERGIDLKLDARTFFVDTGTDYDSNLITSATGYTNHRVTYSFRKLEERGLIHVGEPETVERFTGGQKRVFEVNTAGLTEAGRQYLEDAG
jgi:hypothetical protein